MESPKFLYASTIPWATRSHFTIPPKYLPDCLPWGLLNQSKAVSTLLASAVPPTSRKFGGSPPAA